MCVTFMPREKVLNIHELQQSHVNHVNKLKKKLAFFKVVLLAVMGQGLTSKLGTECKVVVGFLQQFADTPQVSLHSPLDVSLVTGLHSL